MENCFSFLSGRTPFIDGNTGLIFDSWTEEKGGKGEMRREFPGIGLKFKRARAEQEPWCEAGGTGGAGRRPWAGGAEAGIPTTATLLQAPYSRPLWDVLLFCTKIILNQS